MKRLFALLGLVAMLLTACSAPTSGDAPALLSAAEGYAISGDAYALLGFKLEWKSGPWTAYLQADNLTDRRYASSYAIRNQATAAQPGYLPGLGRNVAAGVSYQF